MEIVAEVKGLDHQRLFHTQLAQAWDEEFRLVLRQTGEEAKVKSQAAAPVFRGVLRDRIRVKLSLRRLTAVVKPAAPHSSLVTFGRRPGKMPPPAALRDWAAMHGMQPGKEFLIARAIAKRGTKPHPFMVAVDEQTFAQRVRDAADRAVRRFKG